MTGDEIDSAKSDETTGDEAVETAGETGSLNPGDMSPEDVTNVLKKLTAREGGKELLAVAGRISRTTVGRIRKRPESWLKPLSTTRTSNWKASSSIWQTATSRVNAITNSASEF